MQIKDKPMLSYVNLSEREILTKFGYNGIPSEVIV